MKIVHICIGAFYPDGYSYQENMLPKFHKEFGNEVFVIAGLDTYDQEGHSITLKKGGEYIGDYGIPVCRLDYAGEKHIARKLKRYSGLFYKLKEINPDIIFIHNCQFISIFQVIRYLKEFPSTQCYVDNHADFSNSATTWVSRYILHGILWRKCAASVLPYTKKFYGVLPARVDFLREVYKLPANKCELLVMGADDDLIKYAANSAVRKQIRNQNGIEEYDLLIVTGGKINSYRPETLFLMKAVIDLNIQNVKLLVFGNVSEELRDEFNGLCNSKKIIYIGWVKSSYTYSLFSAADLIVFPGLHSVMWEQAVAQGKPCLFRKIDGFNHVDIGGNALFLDNSSKEEIQSRLQDLIDHPEKMAIMKKIAEEKGMDIFSYRNIAKRSIEEGE